MIENFPMNLHEFLLCYCTLVYFSSKERYNYPYPYPNPNPNPKSTPDPIPNPKLTPIPNSTPNPNLNPTQKPLREYIVQRENKRTISLSPPAPTGLPI